MIKDIPAGNVLLSAAIVFAGALPTKTLIFWPVLQLVLRHFTSIKSCTYTQQYHEFGINNSLT